jgi:hypothetical protein
MGRAERFVWFGVSELSRGFPEIDAFFRGLGGGAGEVSGCPGAPVSSVWEGCDEEEAAGRREVGDFPWVLAERGREEEEEGGEEGGGEAGACDQRVFLACRPETRISKGFVWKKEYRAA